MEGMLSLDPAAAASAKTSPPWLKINGIVRWFTQSLYGLNLQLQRAKLGNVVRDACSVSREFVKMPQCAQRFGLASTAYSLILLCMERPDRPANVSNPKSPDRPDRAEPATDMTE